MLKGEGYEQVRTGSLLISEPWCDAPYFKRSVVLLVERNESGDIGFVLNKCMRLNICDLVEDFPERDFTLCLGGPVNPSTLHFIHNVGDVIIPGSVHIAGNVYWGGNFSVAKQLINSGIINAENIKFFIGYSGWSKGQLKDEFDAGGWGVSPLSGHDIINSTENLWYEVVHKSSNYSEWGLIPEDPADN